jgi:hypothetical protein
MNEDFTTRSCCLPPPCHTDKWLLVNDGNAGYVEQGPDGWTWRATGLLKSNAFCGVLLPLSNGEIGSIGGHAPVSRVVLLFVLVSAPCTGPHPLS